MPQKTERNPVPMPAEQVSRDTNKIVSKKPITLDEVLNLGGETNVFDHPFQFDYANRRIVIIPRIQGYTLYLTKATGQTLPILQVDSFKMSTGAGTGLVLTSDADGDATWQATGVPTSLGSFLLAATGTVDGANTAFTFTQLPAFIVSDGTMWRENNGWTWNAGTLTATMTLPPTYDIYGLL